MATTRKWSTGKLGNDYPDHSNNGNPNTRGLSNANLPGVEAYIEEDDLVAKLDNRPLKNLSLNDDILEENISIVASEVDYGVLHNKDKEFDIEILPVGDYKLQDDTLAPVTISPIRIHSGQAIVNGASVTVGRQKIAYLIKNDGATIFPDYDFYSNTNIVLVDDPGYTGDYRPVYSSSTEFPTNYSDYEVKIINEYAEGIDPRTVTFKTYRNYEDIIPPAPEVKPQSGKINFGYDGNFTRESEGVWLVSEFSASKWELIKVYSISASYFRGDFVLYSTGLYKANKNPSSSFIAEEWDHISEIANISIYNKLARYEIGNIVNYNGDIYYAKELVLPSIGLNNIKINNAVIKKDMEIDEYLLPTNEFELNENGNWAYDILTNKIFYNDVKFATDVDFKFEIADIYITNDNTIYVIYKPRRASDDTKLLDNLYIIPNGTSQASHIELKNSLDQEIKKMVMIRDKLFILGTNGYLSYFDTTIINNTKMDQVVIPINDILAIMLNNPKLGGAPNTETYVDMLEFNDELFILTESGLLLHEFYNGKININSFTIENVKTEINLKSINVFDKATLLSVLSGNLYTDSSLKSVIRNYIQNPSFEKGSINQRPPFWDGDLLISQDAARHGSCKAKLNGTGTQRLKGVFSAGTKITLSFYCKVPSGANVDLSVSISGAGNTTQQTFSASVNWERYIITHTVTAVGEIAINFTSATDTFIDCIQLEKGEVANRFVVGYDYLLIGFQKNFVNVSDPCFALIDADNLYEVQYDVGKYGNIKTITQVIPGGNNDATFTDGKYIYKLTMLNSVGEYDRYSIINLSKANPNYNILGRVEKINSICYFDNKLFIGGSILNKSIKINIDTSNDLSIDSGSQNVRFLTDYNEVYKLGYGGMTDLTRAVPISTRSTGICSITDILGEYKVVNAHGSNMQSVEFTRTEDLYETLDEIDGLGRYVPYKKYFLALQVGSNRPIVFEFAMPGPYFGSISIDYLFKQIISPAYTREYNKIFNTEIWNRKHKSEKPLHMEIIRSTAQMDGLYSTGVKDLSVQFRSDIQKIVPLPSNDTFSHYNKCIYVLTKVDILKGQYDQNIRKTESGDYLRRPSDTNGVVNKIMELPISAPIDAIYEVKDFGFYKWNGVEWIDSQFIYKWKIKSNYKLKEVEYKYNVPFIFTTEGVGNNYLDLPVTVGYNIVPGSLRIKTNLDTEYGFSENVDYYVDYDTNKIILSTNQNLLFESDFDNVNSGVTSSSSSFWKKELLHLGEDGGVAPTVEFKKTIENFETFNGESVSKDSYTITYISSQADNTASIYQIYEPKSLNIGDTYTFSLKFKALIRKFCNIYVIESNEKVNSVNDLLSKQKTMHRFGLTNEDFEILIQEDVDLKSVAALNQWHTKSVTHTVTQSDSKYIYVMFSYESDSGAILHIKEPQLERNQIATQYIPKQLISKIDNGSSVYLDFAEIKELDGDLTHTYRDYTFDTDNHRLIYHKNIQGKQLYLTYVYEREFNKYVFPSSIPKFDVITDSKDDVFIHYFSGRVWAINSMMAIISQDNIYPMTITYDYIIPRIDKIKLRNIPDLYGNYVYYVKGMFDELNPYSPYDSGIESSVYADAVGNAGVQDTENNDMLYTINVIDENFLNNDIYDRRIYVESKSHKNFNMSLYHHTAGYFPFIKDFQSTSGIGPLNKLTQSKITEIIKNFSIRLLDEVGAWSDSYDLTLRNKTEMPSSSLFMYVNTKNGDDTVLQPNEQAPLLTINEAVRRIKHDHLPAYIMIINDDFITEDVNIDYTDKLRIFARTKATWRGNIQNLTEVMFQGFIFEGHNFYVANSFEFYYCTFIDCTVNDYIPVTGRFYNCIIRDSKNTFLYVRNTIIPSPFVYPYMKNVSQDDDVLNSEDFYGATSDAESIHPDAGLFLRTVSLNASGDYTFTNCLLYNNYDSIIKYELRDSEQWLSTFTMGYCTIVENDLLFYTNKVSQTFMIKESIIYKCGRDFGTPKLFDSVSNINLLNNYINQDNTLDSSWFNNAGGIVYGLNSCLNGTLTEPGFINEDVNNFKLKSEAAGFLANSICVSRSTSGDDLGCYNESRNRLDVMIPKKLKSPLAYIAESISYPLILNSEKITFSVEIKPLTLFTKPAILFDTRTRPDDVDYVMVCYNNNANYDTTDFNEHSDNPDTNPRTFKIIIANEQTKYAVVSPIEITSDDSWQSWHRLSFTVNFEMVYTGKSSFDEKDRYQNIITFYHNDAIASESYLKNDMNYDSFNNLLKLKNGAENAWNYNNISKYITIGGAFDGTNVLTGYYSELRIDNRFIDRKELEKWNSKEVPFNDPIKYTNQDNFVRTFDSNIIQDLWTLRTDFDVGMKGHKLGKNTAKQIVYHEGEQAWAIGELTENLLHNPDLAICPFAYLDTDESLIAGSGGKFPISLTGTITITTRTDPLNKDPKRQCNEYDVKSGAVISFKDPINPNIVEKQFETYDELVSYFEKELADPKNQLTKINIKRLENNKIRFISSDIHADIMNIHFTNSGDPKEIGFSNNNPSNNEMEYLYTKGSSDSATIIGNTAVVNPHVTILGVETDRFENSAYSSSDEAHVYNSKHTSLGLKKTVERGSDQDIYDNSKSIRVYFETVNEISLSNVMNGDTFYTFSIYAYNNAGFVKNQVKFVISREGEEDQYVDFDHISNTTGFWWRLDKTFTVPVLHQDAALNDITAEKIKVGLQVYGECECIIDSFQLMEGQSRLPFIVEAKNTNDRIEVDNSLLNKDKGIIFFRFSPLFNYDTSKKHVLAEVLSKLKQDGEVYDESKDYDAQGNKSGNSRSGIRVYYDYNKQLGEGVIHFRMVDINDDTEKPDAYSWDLPVLPQLWDNWHTVAISYDFNLKQYTMFYDYHKNEITAPSSKIEWWTNLYIGHPAYSDTTENMLSADILVRDLLITNYMTSHVEVNNWINAFEFYRESTLNATLQNYQKEMLSAITRIEGISTNTLEIESNIRGIKTKLNVFDNVLNSNINLTMLKTQTDQLRNEVYNDTMGLLVRINQFERLQNDFSTRLTNTENIIMPDIEIYISITNAIADEIKDRVQAIADMRAELASTELGSGASLIGIHDDKNQFAATTVETALIELRDYDDTLDVQMAELIADKDTLRHDFNFIVDGDKGIWSREMSVAHGYNIVQLKQEFDEINNQVLEVSVGLTKETANRTEEIALLDNTINLKIDNLETLLKGANWNNQSIKDNWDLIQTNITDIATINTHLGDTDLAISQMKGTNWDSTMSLSIHAGNIKDLIDTDDSHSQTLETHTDQIENLYENLNNELEQDYNSGEYEASRGTSGVYALINNEINERVAGDQLIRTDLRNTDGIAAGKGADLIGITLADTRYAGKTVQEVIDDLNDRLNHVKDLFNWKDPVDTHTDLPTTGNGVNDTRLVNDDGDGKSAQYSWDGTAWQKVADVDWGTAAAISYSHTISRLHSNTVQDAIDELTEKLEAFNTRTHYVLQADWTLDTDKNMYYVDLEHLLETINVAIRSIMTDTGMEIGVDEYQRLNQNVVRVWATNALDLTVTVFGVKNTYSTVIGNWTPENGKYSITIDHYMNTKNVMVSIFDIESKKRIGVENIEFVDGNSIKVWTQDNSVILNVFLVKRTSEATTKDLNYWKPVAGMYEARMPISTGFDAAYQFYNPVTNLNIEVDDVTLDGQLLIIRKTNADPVRAVIIK